MIVIPLFLVVIPKLPAEGRQQRDLTSQGTAGAVARMSSKVRSRRKHVGDAHHRIVPVSPAFSSRVRDDKRYLQVRDYGRKVLAGDKGRNCQDAARKGGMGKPGTEESV
ncbi:MAG: hypothetical protein DMG97_02635 [Acidobacteria bacterium]|nr:MAG: hypothetical protein DMG97_02635 [Acidobacteriota bacterium]